jgi:hypothetical protein
MALAHQWIRKGDSAITGMKNDEVKWRINQDGFSLGTPLHTFTLTAANLTSHGEFVNTGLAKLFRLGQQIFLCVPRLTGTSTGIFAMTSTVPSGMCPEVNEYFPIPLFNNDTDVAMPGSLRIGTDGSLQVFGPLSENGFAFPAVQFTPTLGHDGGIGATTVSWTL